MNTKQTALLMEAEDGASLWHDAWLRLKKNRAAVTGGVVLAVMVILAILTPWIAPYGYEAQNLDLGATPPSATHWLGTDIFGRDLLTQILYGGRISLAVAAFAIDPGVALGCRPQAAKEGAGARQFGKMQFGIAARKKDEVGG
jgi:oligopeptide transport system permease protein